ncbi:hypothetical protein FHG87_021902 [Trinorchestia longiramus]|nr:hypothetical protein FHG87_021902 [Trinorchestia longiramus]
MATRDVLSACKHRPVRYAATNLQSIDVQTGSKEHSCLRTATGLEDAAYIERCTTDVTLTVREKCSAAYVAGWLEMKCANNVSFIAEEPLLTSDVKEFIETVSRGPLTTPHVRTFDLVRCGLCFIKKVRHDACCQERLLQILSTLASFSGIVIDYPKMFRHLANVVLNGLHNLRKDQQNNTVLLQVFFRRRPSWLTNRCSLCRVKYRSQPSSCFSCTHILSKQGTFSSPEFDPIDIDSFTPDYLSCNKQPLINCRHEAPAAAAAAHHLSRCWCMGIPRVLLRGVCLNLNAMH